MDIKTLLDNLHDEVLCSVCMCTFTDPKQLPCLHSFDAVDNQAKKSLESVSQKKDQVENQVKLIDSAIEQTKGLVKRSFSTEILGFSETFDAILQEQDLGIRHL